MRATVPEPNPIEGLAMRAISEERQGGFFPDLNPECGPNQGWVAKNAKIRCFICQRFTIHKYSGWKNALEGCGVWFHKKIVSASGAGARSANSSYRNLMRQYKAGYPETHATIRSAGRKRKA